MPRGSATAVQKTLGPGYLFGAALGSTEPAATLPLPAWAAAWFPFGYTEDGSSFSYEVTSEPIEVAEELERIATITTGRNMTVSFQLAELTQFNLKAALNGGLSAIADPTSGAAVVFEPPDLGTEVRIMLGWQSETGAERYIFRQCFQTGSIEMQRRKGAQKALLPVEFTLEKPATGLKAFARHTDLTLKGGPAS